MQPLPGLTPSLGAGTGDWGTDDGGSGFGGCVVPGVVGVIAVPPAVAPTAAFVSRTSWPLISSAPRRLLLPARESLNRFTQVSIPLRMPSSSGTLMVSTWS